MTLPEREYLSWLFRTIVEREDEIKQFHKTLDSVQREVRLSVIQIEIDTEYLSYCKACRESGARGARTAREKEGAGQTSRARSTVECDSTC